MQPQQPYGSPHGPTANYDFILNPQTAQKPRRLSLSPTGRIFLILGAVFVLLVLFVAIKNTVASPSKNYPSLLNVVQQQQELIHLTSSAAQQNDISDDSKNFALTTQASLTSEQTDLLTYLQKGGKKVAPKVLNQKLNSSLDTELSAAATAGTYDATFKEISQAQLTTYKQALANAYRVTPGPKGRALLSQDYYAANLLLTQLTGQTQ